MAIRYIVVRHPNPRDPQAKALYYLKEKTVGRFKYVSLIAEMVRNTSLTPYEAAAALDYLFASVTRLLSSGHTVKLGPLGYFKVVLHSEGVDTLEQVSTRQLKRIKLIFVPGKRLRQQIAEMTIEQHPDLRG